jgi:hypothetical protein
MKLPRGLVPILTLLGLYGCSDSYLFTSSTEQVRSNGDGSRSPIEGANPTRISDAALGCNMSEWKNGKPTKIKRLFVPVSCLVERIETNEPNRTLDVMFVLDVTGSMGNELNAVRAGVKELITTIQAQGWQLRAGSIAFADAILEEVPISADLEGLLNAMNPIHETWSARGGFGGDAPEVGLAALERGLTLLDEADGAATVGEKIVVYVSDAPAEREHKKGFDIGATAQALKAFTVRLDASPQKPSFRLFHSTGSDRRSLTDLMPTPSEQIKEIVAQSGVANVKLPFPLDAKGVQEQFITKLAEGRLLTERCTLKSVVLLSPEGIVLSASGTLTESANTYYPFKVPTALRRGAYKLELVKSCLERGEVEETVDLKF